MKHKLLPALALGQIILLLALALMPAAKVQANAGAAGVLAAAPAVKRERPLTRLNRRLRLPPGRGRPLPTLNRWIR